MKIRLDLPYVKAFLGSAYVHAGRISEGLALLDEARQSAGSLKLVASLTWIAILMGEAEAARGDHRAATTLADEALDRAQALGERGWEAWARHLKADILCNETATRSDALEEFDKSLALANELGLRPLGARVALGLARAHRHLGNRGAARGFLDDALSRLREMDMPYWTTAAEHELSQLR